MAVFAGRAIVCCLVAFAVGCVRPTSTSPGDELPAAVKPTGQTVTLVVDFDDGLEKHYLLAWRDGMTVLDALVAAANRRRGIALERRGDGERALVTKIDGVANEAGGGGNAWLYDVNGAKAQVGAGAYVLRPGDAVLWKFAQYE